VIKTRPANKSDAPFITWVMQEAARSHLEKGMWDLAFPGPEQSRLKILAAFTTLQTIHFGHWSRFLFAEENGTPGLSSMHLNL